MRRSELGHFVVSMVQEHLDLLPVPNTTQQFQTRDGVCNTSGEHSQEKAQTSTKIWVRYAMYSDTSAN